MIQVYMCGCCMLQIHSNRAPAALQPLHDEAGDAAANEYHVVGGALHLLHTHVLERLARRHRLRDELGTYLL